MRWLRSRVVSDSVSGGALGAGEPGPGSSAVGGGTAGSGTGRGRDAVGGRERPGGALGGAFASASASA